MSLVPLPIGHENDGAIIENGTKPFDIDSIKRRFPRPQACAPTPGTYCLNVSGIGTVHTYRSCAAHQDLVTGRVVNVIGVRRWCRNLGRNLLKRKAPVALVHSSFAASVRILSETTGEGNMALMRRPGFLRRPGF